VRQLREAGEGRGVGHGLCDSLREVHDLGQTVAEGEGAQRHRGLEEGVEQRGARLEQRLSLRAQAYRHLAAAVRLLAQVRVQQRLSQRLRRARAAARQRRVRHGQPQPRAQLARRRHLRRAQLAALAAARRRVREGGCGDGHELCCRGERGLVHSWGAAAAGGGVAQRVHVGPEVGGRRQPQHRADARVACRAAHGAHTFGTRVAHAVERCERQQQHE